MKNRIVLSIIACSIVFSGCTVSDMSQNKSFDSLAKDVVKEKKEPIISNNVNEIIVEKTFVDLSYDKRLSVVLKELGDLEKISYYLSINNKSKDITIPAISNQFKVRIKDFEDLNSYVQDVLGSTLVITKNEFLSTKTKVVEIQDSKEHENSLAKIRMEINANNNNFKEIMTLVSKTSGFNIIYGHDIDMNLNDLNINYHGDNLQGLISYIEESFNLYVDIDYKHKVIKFEKYKKRYFDLVVSDNNINGTTDNESITAIQGGTALPTTTSKALTKTISIGLYKDLKENLNTLFSSRSTGTTNTTLGATTGATTSTTSSSYYILNNTTGKIMVNADKVTMKAAEKVIDEFNDSFAKQVKVNLEVFEVMVSNDKNFGIDGKFSYDLKNSKSFESGSNISGSITNNVAANIFTFNKIDNKFPMEVFISSLNSVGKIVNSNSYFMMTRNHIPYNKRIVTSTDYVKSVRTTTNTGTTTITSTQESTQETNTANEGFTITMIPNIVGENISLNINPNITQLLEMKDEIYNNSKITLPKTNAENFTSEVILKDGEKFVIGSVTTYEKADNYKGVLPIENFAIGGNNGSSFLRKETVFVLSAEIIKK